MPSPSPASALLPLSSFEGIPEVPNYNSQSAPGLERQRTSWFSPSVDFPLHSCILPSRREAASQRAPRDYTLTKEVSGCTLFPEPTLPPLFPALAFLFLGIEDNGPWGLSQDPSSVICPFLQEVCPDLAALPNRTFCNDGDVLYLSCPTLATVDC